jgi:hypothetical protein
MSASMHYDCGDRRVGKSEGGGVHVMGVLLYHMSTRVSKLMWPHDSAAKYT